MSSRWDCRWPDPIALKVASDRTLRARPPQDPALNRRLPIRVHIVPPKSPETAVHAILITPWAVERVYWSNSFEEPEIQHAAPLILDEAGRVAAGIGLLLKYEEIWIPVLTAWEPEIGHHFIETLLHSVHPYSTTDEALAASLGNSVAVSRKHSITEQLNQKLSRRNLLGIFRS